MTEWLVRRFVKNYQNSDDPKVRMTYGKFAGIVGIVCNVLLCLGKGIAGLVSGSVSIVADAVNNLSDASSNIISLLGFKLAGKPADSNHPYGHGRYEYLSGLLVAMLIVVIGVELIKSSIEKIVNPEPTDFSWVVVGILVASILVKLWMALFNRTIGKRIGSTTLEATAIDSRNDVITTAAVLAALLVSHYTSLELDGWAGLVVGVFIVWSGIGLVRDTVNPLLGSAPSPELVEHIRAKIMSYPGVLGTHDLMVHDYGPGRQFVLASHDVLDNIEQDFLRDDNLVMTIHFDPIVTADESVNNLRSWIDGLVSGIDGRLSIHDLRTVPGPTHTNVIFDCLKPHGVEMTDDELRRKICALVEAEHPEYSCKITVDSSYVSSRQ